MARPTSGNLTIPLGGTEYRATWRVVSGRVEVTCPELGVDSAALGPLAAAPATLARETLVQLHRRVNREAKPKADTARFNIRDA